MTEKIFPEFLYGIIDEDIIEFKKINVSNPEKMYNTMRYNSTNYSIRVTSTNDKFTFGCRQPLYLTTNDAKNNLIKNLEHQISEIKSKIEWLNLAGEKAC